MWATNHSTRAAPEAMLLRTGKGSKPEHQPARPRKFTAWRSLCAKTGWRKGGSSSVWADRPCDNCGIQYLTAAETSRDAASACPWLPAKLTFITPIYKYGVGEKCSYSISAIKKIRFSMGSLKERRISALSNKGVQNKPILYPFQLYFYKSFLTGFIAVIASSG